VANVLCNRVALDHVGLSLEECGKTSGGFFRPVGSFILMTENGRRALIPIVLAPVTRFTSYSLAGAGRDGVIACFCSLQPVRDDWTDYALVMLRLRILMNARAEERLQHENVALREEIDQSLDV